jgi:predicted nucleic acid-binding protein
MNARYLLDVNTLIALLWGSHAHNGRVERWLGTVKTAAVCPLTETGFVRISTQAAFGATVDQARTMLKVWKAAKKPEFIPCDLELLKTSAPAAGTKTTGFYLAGLAEAHGMKLATLDEGIKHPAAVLVN